MAVITAIEFDGDTCAIARTTVRRGEVTVSAAELLNPTSFPGTDAFVAALRRSRRTLGLPRRSRVVLWGLPEGATPRDPGAVAALAPLIAAGFRVERVVTPCNALGALARLKPARPGGAACWVAINTAGVAIVAIRPGQQIYARSFGWDSSVGATGSQARMLQRYSLVAYLSPEIKRALAAAGAIGSPVSAVVTCGNLPDLRALTMPLIEELDVEVETLDSLDGLQIGTGTPERLTELAAAIRLASAGVMARRSRPWDDSKRIAAHRTAVLMRAAALVALLAGGGGAYLWFARLPAPPASSSSAAVPAEARSVQTAAPRPADPPAATSGRAAPPRTDPAPPRREALPPQVARPTPAAPRADPAPRSPVEPPRRAESTPAQEEPPRLGAEPRYRPGEPEAPPPVAKEPLPRVTAILFSQDRRFATIDDGRVVGVGDRIGGRVVVAIDERTVTLREPSGARVRIRLDGRASAARRIGIPWE
ncbi:MAG TPA: hypothetical protein VFK57_15610 [Vicinamibacterales bacterium]|nr:hypothetical protein [Vicinamibacterales bacterium]